MAEVPQGRLGFYDAEHGVFYEVESPEEYQRCLEYLHRRIEEQSRPDPLDFFDDFDSLVEELDQKDKATEPQLEMCEF
jgi:hypothetical protein